MKEELLDLLYSYLEDDCDLDAIRDWIDLNVWTASQEDRDIIDQVAIQLAYIDDGNSSEHHFQTRMADILLPTLDVPVWIDIQELASVLSAVAENSLERLTVMFRRAPTPQQPEETRFQPMSGTSRSFNPAIAV